MKIDQFLQYIEFEKRYSQHTVQSYRRDLLQFEEYLDVVYQTSSFKDVNDQMVRSWLADFMEEGLASKTINRKLSTLKSFYRFLSREEYISINPVTKIQGPKLKKRLPVFIKESNMEQLFSHEIDYSDFEQVRNLLIMELFYATGIRRAELMSLTIQNVNLYEKQIKVLGKRNKERIIPIGDDILKLFDIYVELREKCLSVENESDFVFLTKKGKKIYPKLVYRVVNSYLSTVSTQDKKSPHVLRHTFATHMLNNGADLNAVKEILGHASLAATQIYTHNTIEKLKKIYQQAHPKA